MKLKVLDVGLFMNDVKQVGGWRRVGLESVTVYANFCYGRCKNPKLR